MCAEQMPGTLRNQYMVVITIYPAANAITEMKKKKKKKAEQSPAKPSTNTVLSFLLWGRDRGELDQKSPGNVELQPRALWTLAAFGIKGWAPSRTL